MENFTIQMTPAMLGLVPLVVIILQVIKQIPLAAKLSAWMPLISVAAGVGAAYLTTTPDPIVGGIMVGLMACGAFDTYKKLSPPTTPPLAGSVMPILLAGLLLMTSCAGPNDSPQKQYKLTAQNFTFTVEQLTLIQKAGGFNESQSAAIDICIDQGQACLHRWRKALSDVNTPPPDFAICVLGATKELLIWQGRKK